jgi:hypothetical protein
MAGLDVRRRPGQAGGGPRAIVVDQLQAWLNSLPPEVVQQKAYTYEAAYVAPAAPPSQIAVGSFQVTDGFVEVITDSEFYAIAPAGGFGMPPQRIPSGALLGLIRFALKFGDRDPMQITSGVRNPYLAATAAGAAAASGWGWTNLTFGAQRMPSFAIYAKSSERIEVTATIDNLPRFPITKLGMVLYGFTVPESTFGEIWLP